MYNVHPYSSLKNLGEKYTLYPAKYDKLSVSFFAINLFKMYAIKNNSKI